MTDFADDFTMTIDGRAVSGHATIDVVNPSTETLVGRAPDSTKAQLDEAVAAARRAFPGWRATPLAERRAAVANIGVLLQTHADAFARLFTLEQGRPLDKAKGEVLGAAFWCDAVSKLEIPVLVNEDSPTRRSETRHVPLGVVGAIVPWNFPVMLAIWKLAPALLAGNTIVLKPSPFTPLTMLKLGELLRDHLPPGVLNVVSGGDQLGPWLTEHPDVDKISFTGSSATGRRVMASAAGNLKRVTLELGGNDAAIVLADADVDKIAEKLFWAAFGNTGQICLATKRVYIHSDIYDALAAALVAQAQKVKIGDGLEQGVELGPLQNRQQYQRVRELMEDAKASGLTFLTGGEAPAGKGYFLPITLVDNPPEDSRVVVEEAFGPVLPLLKFDDVADAIERTNNSPYGLAASIWTSDPEKGAEVAAQIEAGTVWVNEVQHLTPWISFGGHKQSGLGVENGIDGLLAYTNSQTISINKS